MSNRKKRDEPMSPGARALIDEVRDLDGPKAADRERVKRALLATMASGAGLAATTVASSTAAAGTVAATTTATAGGVSLGVKIAVAAMVAAALGGTALVVTQPDEDVAPRRAMAVPAESDALIPPTDVTEPVVAEDSSERVEAPLVEAPLVEAPLAEAPLAEAPLAVARTTESRRARRSPTTPAVPDSSPDSTLTAEMVLLRRAQRALQAGEPNVALRHLDDHASRFASGVLAEEREAARVVALCQAGHGEESRALAQRFVRERPSSPHRARVLGACQEP